MQFTHAGAVLTLPRLEADLPLLSAVWRDRVDISRLVARGWTLDLTRYDGTLAVTPRPAELPAAPFSLISTAYAAPALPARKLFEGVARGRTEQSSGVVDVMVRNGGNRDDRASRSRRAQPDQGPEGDHVSAQSLAQGPLPAGTGLVNSTLGACAAPGSA
ncbi:hypothetical protein F9K50_05845 [bacterium]|nr:MAG: hypothetical protein F9K50_05845 [bacterium]